MIFTDRIWVEGSSSGTKTKPRREEGQEAFKHRQIFSLSTSFYSYENGILHMYHVHRLLVTDRYGLHEALVGSTSARRLKEHLN